MKEDLFPTTPSRAESAAEARPGSKNHRAQREAHVADAEGVDGEGDARVHRTGITSDGLLRVRLGDGGDLSRGVEPTPTQGR